MGPACEAAVKGAADEAVNDRQARAAGGDAAPPAAASTKQGVREALGGLTEPERTNDDVQALVRLNERFAVAELDSDESFFRSVLADEDLVFRKANGVRVGKAQFLEGSESRPGIVFHEGMEVTIYGQDLAMVSLRLRKTRVVRKRRSREQPNEISEHAAVRERT